MSFTSPVLRIGKLLLASAAMLVLYIAQPAQAAEFDQCFLFIDSEQDNTKKSRYRLVPWSDADKQATRNAISQVLKSSPGLGVLSAAPNKFPLGRVARVGAESITSGKFNAAAATHFNLMVFADNFFSETEVQQLQAVAHELTHSADVGESLAFSKTWTGFAMPRIRKTRALSKLYPKAIADTRVRLMKIFPDAYAGDNLIESLAVCFASFQQGKDEVEFDQRIDKEIFDKLQHPTAQMIEFAGAYRVGTRLLEAESYDDAVKQFRRCEEISPDNPCPTAFIARCFAAKRDNDSTLRECDIALSKLNALAVDNADSFRLAILRAKERAFYEQGNLAAAAACCTESLRCERPGPFRQWQLELRNVYYEQKEEWSKAAADLLSLNDMKGTWHSGHDDLIADVDPEFMRAQLDVAVSNHPDEIQPLLLRAGFREALADNETNKEEKTRLYTRALADLGRALKSGNSSQALLCTAQIYAKLSRFDDAEKALSFLQKDQNYLNCEVPIQIAILEGRGKKNEAKLLYVDFRRRLASSDMLTIPFQLQELKPKPPAQDALKDVG